MKFFVTIALSLTLAGAAPVFADDAQDFTAACLKAGGASDVCTCKGRAAVKLLDDRMLGLVILSMGNPGKFQAESAKLTHADNVRWTDYIRESNQACGLNY